MKLTIQMPFDLLDADVLSGEDLKVDFALADADAAAMGDGNGPVMKRILELA